jgi:hypothetical protein
MMPSKEGLHPVPTSTVPVAVITFMAFHVAEDPRTDRVLQTWNITSTDSLGKIISIVQQARKGKEAPAETKGKSSSQRRA